MPFEKGRSGNPNGRPKKAKEFSDALRITLNEVPSGDKKRLRRVADKLVEEAENGNIQAIKEIADRVEGKVAQALEAEVDATLNVNILKFSDADNTDPE